MAPAVQTESKVNRELCYVTLKSLLHFCNWPLICFCETDLRQELAVQQKQQVQDRKPSLSSAVKEPSSSSSASSTAGLPTPPLTPPDKRNEDKTTSLSSNQPAPLAATPSRPLASGESFCTPPPSVSRGQFMCPDVRPVTL